MRNLSVGAWCRLAREAVEEALDRRCDTVQEALVVALVPPLLAALLELLPPLLLLLHYYYCITTDYITGVLLYIYSVSSCSMSPCITWAVLRAEACKRQ